MTADGGRGGAGYLPVVSETGSSVEDGRSGSHVHPELITRTRTPGKLVVVVAALATAVVSLAAAVAVLATINSKSGEKMALMLRRPGARTCVSEACAKSASRILESLDTTAEPCEDFYQFACGGWIRRHPVPESQSSWDQFRLLREDLLIDLRELLEAENKEDDLRPVKQARALYRTCLDVETLERLGVEPMLAVMRQLRVSAGPPGGVAGQRDAPFDWVLTLGRAQRMLGLSALIGFWVSQDMRNTSRNLMVVDQVAPGISERYLLDPARFATELSEYRRYVRDMVHAFERRLDNRVEPEDDMQAFAEGFADEILTFSTQLAKIMTSAEARRDTRSLFHEMHIPDLQLLMDAPGDGKNPKMNWTRYLDAVLQNTNVTLNPSSDVVVVMDASYLQKLASLIAATDPLRLERFVWWNVFSTLAPLTLQEFRDLAFRFSQHVYGLTQKTARWKGCTGNVNSNFGMAVSYLYVQKHFNNESRVKALEMVNDIRNAFTEMVGELQWMDGVTKARTLEKAHAMRPFIGFPGWLLTPGELEKHYNETEVVEGQLFETYLKLSQTSIKRTLEDIRRSPDYNRWVTPATTVNAFYSPILNSVTFPAGILQPPFYGLGLESLNYGAIGAIMGHELTHGFDDQGRRYDKHGNLKQWWTDTTLTEYEKRVKCIVDQYSHYQVNEIGDNFTVNGINTQGENIADNGGIREALRAYQKFQARHGNQTELLLPGLSQYSPEQLFYIGFAHMWCGNSTKGALKSRVVEGVHSPNRYRVIGTLSNSEDFSKAWNCKPGSPMNPEKKCVLW
ncbi:neprilysin-4-like isoform X1 [Schistocerca gregaria]|uniref:neprilysin-4-like isoform X1 n=1 Tax=Schistocerca gregaria TaxID=7010 RepID=UPI00211E3809|nr:neprilysin-4-like isoform X1 [Schistocerca gregaria]